MNSLFAIVFMLSIPGLIISLVYPRAFRSFPYLKDRLTRIELSKHFLVLMISSLILFGVTAEEAGVNQVSSDLDELIQEQESTVKHNEERVDEAENSALVEEPDLQPSDDTSEVLDKSEEIETEQRGDEIVSGVEKTEYFLVSEVVDGDTFKVMIHGVEETVRLIGVDTPETKHPNKPVECFGVEASHKTKSLLMENMVRLDIDASQGDVDTYGRLLRHVFLEDGTNINLLLIEEGYAYEYTYDMPYLYQSEYKAAQTSAKESLSGLWGATCDDVVEDGVVGGEVTEEGGTCVIKGNISSNDDEKIYHVPGCDSYNQTKISEDKGERWFCTEQEALDAGWRKALNCV